MWQTNRCIVENLCFQKRSYTTRLKFYSCVKGFKIKFFFETNPYFENESLTKEYQLDSKGEPTSSSTDIRWKEGYDLTARAAQRAAVAKGAQRKRKLETRTFFTWYSDNEDPANDDVGEIIKDDLW